MAEYMYSESQTTLNFSSRQQEIGNGETADLEIAQDKKEQVIPAV